MRSLFYHISLLPLTFLEIGLWHASTSLAAGLTKTFSHPTTQFYAPLRKRQGNVKRSLSKRSKIPYYGVAKASDPSSGNWWVEVRLGNQTLELLLDTGSSDTWVLHDGFECTNGTHIQPASYCAAGPYFKGTFSGGKSVDEHYNTTYYSGQYVFGQVGYEQISLAGITVPRQKIGLIDSAYWPAGAAGLLGLAFPAHTLAIYPGTNGTYDDEPGHEARHYSPFFASLVAEGSVPPIFSLALAANGSGESYIAFGGLPPVEVEGRLVSTPMLLEQDRYNDTEYHHYNIAVDAFTSPSYNQSTPINSSSTTAIVDSGSIAIAAPPAVVAAYSALFSPPAYFVPDIGIYVTTCDARGPIEPFHVVINGTTFSVPGSAFVLTESLAEEGYGEEYKDLCFSGLQETIGLGNLLGRPFMESVVAVHDVGAKEMRFAQRSYTGTV